MLPGRSDAPPSLQLIVAVLLEAIELRAERFAMRRLGGWQPESIYAFTNTKANGPLSHTLFFHSRENHGTRL
jgi:hypothetical protein